MRTSTLALLSALGVSQLSVIAASPNPAFAAVSFGIRVSIAPPPLPAHVQPPLPGRGYIWVPGYWAWDDVWNEYFWVPGAWVRAPRVGFLWTPGYWSHEDGFFTWYAGYWAPTVGYYGGIRYGCGYNGRGYFGGNWRKGVFHYNRYVNNLGDSRFVHSYSRSVPNNEMGGPSYYHGSRRTAHQTAPQSRTMGRLEATLEQKRHQQISARERSRTYSRHSFEQRRRDLLDYNHDGWSHSQNMNSGRSNRKMEDFRSVPERAYRPRIASPPRGHMRQIEGHRSRGQFQIPQREHGAPQNIR